MDGRGLVNRVRELTIEVEEVGVFEVEEAGQGPRVPRHVRVRSRYFNIILGLANRVHSDLGPQDHSLVTRETREVERGERGSIPPTSPTPRGK